MPFRTEAPAGLTTDTFVLRPITADDAALDHAAVMETRDFLRVWEQTSWPADDFTVAANRADLEGLEERHSDRRAYTYTVLDPTGTECLGCVYLMPPDASMYDGARITPVGDHRWDDHAAAVYFWVRASRLPDGTDRTLLDALRRWLAQDWDLGPHVFVTHEQLTRQVELLADAGLQLRFTVEEAGKPGRYLAFG